MVWSVVWSAQAGDPGDSAATTARAATVDSLLIMRVLISGEGEGDGDVQPLGCLGDALVQPVLTGGGRVAHLIRVGAFQQAVGLLPGEDGGTAVAMVSAQIDLGQAAPAEPLDVAAAGSLDGAADTDPHAQRAAAGAIDGIAGILGRAGDGAGPGMDVDPWLGVPAGHVVDGDDAFVIVAGIDTARVAAPDTAVHVPQDVPLQGAPSVDVEGRAGDAAVPGGQDVPLAVDGALGVEPDGALGVVAAAGIAGVHHDPAAQRRVARELAPHPRAVQGPHLSGPRAEGEL